ncbi:unnamed protein product, partial [Mycena citricolor]
RLQVSHDHDAFTRSSTECTSLPMTGSNEAETVNPYLSVVAPLLPPQLSSALTQLRPDADATIDTLIRFVSGSAAPGDDQEGWKERQDAALLALQGMGGSSPSGSASGSGTAKRSREGDNEPAAPEAKRTKLGTPASAVDNGDARFVLHAVSVTSPVRKKVDLTVCERGVEFVNPTTGAAEASVPLADLKRAFILPTRGKTKAHWTLVVLSADTADTRKSAKAPAAPQIILGLDAIASSAIKCTTHGTDAGTMITTYKPGEHTRDVLLTLAASLRVPVFQPSPDVFKSACPGLSANASGGGVPGVEAYRAAKVGTLWFMSEGILWGESKPCEFWALEDLLSKDDGLRMISATGRTCTVLLTRKTPREGEGAAELGEGEEDPGIETAFSMVDGREQDAINKWVREHRSLFGVEKRPGVGAVTVQDDSDEEDSDFEADSESDGGSASSDSEESEEDGDEDGTEEAQESGDENENDGDGEEEEQEEEELSPEHHPLMRAGAMPKMSKAMTDMVANMVVGDMMGGDNDGEDELQDD